MMYSAKIFSHGRITVPAEIRRLLGLHPGDKVLFEQDKYGEVVLSKASDAVISEAQNARRAEPGKVATMNALFSMFPRGADADLDEVRKERLEGEG